MHTVPVRIQLRQAIAGPHPPLAGSVHPTVQRNRTVVRLSAVSFSHCARQYLPRLADQIGAICSATRGGGQRHWRLAVGEPAEEMYETTELVCGYLPHDRPRYLMGVGTPINILESIALGVDMFDCVMPTRNARHGMLFTANGVLHIKNQKWATDFSPIDEHSTAETSRVYTKAYLRHLFAAGEQLGGQLATLHNLSFYLWLVGEARRHIVEGTFLAWKKIMVERLGQKL